MLRTFVPPFDFHLPRGGRRHFKKMAAQLATQFDTTPEIIDDPIFSYAISGKSQLDRIAHLNDSRPAIVYLSNVVEHSAILIVGECETSDLLAPLEYDSLASFLEAPYVRGYGVSNETPLKAAFDETTIVISDLVCFRNDDDELPDNGLFRVHEKYHDYYICNVLDYDKYFDHCAVFGDAPFFLPSDTHVDLKECVKQLDNYTLREFLLDQAAPFATLGDDHMDDEYIVFYGMDCRQYGDDELTFVR
ncbi:hypothetical protein Pan258_48370 [Symmachiella dynata]|uniref:Uncharacterized protein n=1 Tax=Symmachiella dynata TaxID=2527995 RepID=A0A517ZV99_9PLAN|nr:hypothetical protein [Symmachiella dynata]QDT50756.1 hypothetical protein Pan258_48370 [Symmachiella dynata]QDU46412.1 hypothetical protein Mal52_49320 [Symmachiella dynata]